MVSMGLFLEPEIVSIYWHARFGNSTTFRGWKIPVPKGWWAFTHGDELIVQKMKRFYQRGDPAGIIVDTFNPSKAVEPEAFEDALIHTNSEKGYVFQEHRPIRIGAESGDCLRFSSTKGEELVHISCDSLSAQLALDLYGRASDIPTFYSMVDNIVDDRMTHR